MKNNLGRVTKESDGFKVEFERILNHDIQKVWDAITNPDKIKWWFTDMDIDFRPGGKLIIYFRDVEKSESYGQIQTIEPPHLFEFTWEHELASWQLEEISPGKCKLTLVYSKLDKEFAVNVPAGFHSLLERLVMMLDGSRMIYPFGSEENDPEDLRIQALYEEAIFPVYPELKKLKPLVVEKRYNAPVEKVWQAITDKDLMKKWYFEIPDFTPEIGFVFQFYGEGHKGEQYLHLCKITAVIPLKKLSYRWQYQGYEGKSEVTFDLVTEGKQTILKLTHRGIHSFPDHPDFAPENFAQGWTELIGTLLKNMVEEEVQI